MDSDISPDCCSAAKERQLTSLPGSLSCDAQGDCQLEDPIVWTPSPNSGLSSTLQPVVFSNPNFQNLTTVISVERKFVLYCFLFQALISFKLYRIVYTGDTDLKILSHIQYSIEYPIDVLTHVDRHKQLWTHMAWSWIELGTRFSYQNMIFTDTNIQTDLDIWKDMERYLQ